MKPIFLIKNVFLLIACLVFASDNSAQNNDISLAGTWRFAIDRDDTGIRERWFNRKLDGTIKLPGSMNSNNLGDEVGIYTLWTGSIYDSSFFFQPRLAKYRTPDNYKVPFWLTPLKHYVGVAWYQKDISIPAGWLENKIKLFFERVHIQTRVWVDDKELNGSNQNSLSVPHEYFLPENISAGEHTITVRIDNRITEVNVGTNSHSVSDHTQGNWNGIIGKMLLSRQSPVSIGEVQVLPDIKNKKAVVQLKISNNLGQSYKGKLILSANSFNGKVQHKVPTVHQAVLLSAGESSALIVELPMGDGMQLWNECHPNLYKLNVALSDGNTTDQKEVQFGMREITVSGKNILVNGVPVFLRGNLNNCEFPLTGFPPTDVPAWERVFKIMISFGLNHVRFHSWCPPEAAFIAADKTGFYLQPEAPTWPNHSTSLGDDRFIDQYIFDETNRMQKYYGNYASYVMLAAGNEPRGGRQVEYLTKFINYWKDKDDRRIYTGASVAMSWPLVPANEYMVKSGARNLSWVNAAPESQSDYRNAVKEFTMPYVTHELGQWCVFPDFREIKKYTGAYKARNFELFREDLEDQGTGDKALQFLMASGKLQALCYKHEIEKSLRTPGLSGFQLLGLQDFTGQGTALVGVVNAFYEEKGYISAKDFSRFCNSTVPLSRIEKFVYTNDEIFNADIELFHFGDQPLKAGISWTIKNDQGKILKSGRFPDNKYAIGNNLNVGSVSFSLSGIDIASHLKLEVKVDNTPFANDWDFWVYPSKLNIAQTPEIYYTAALDSNAESILQKGGKVFLNAAGKLVKGREVVQRFLPVFWNTSWFKMRPPHTLGILVDPEHPAFSYFPTSFHSDLQWWEIVNNASVMHLEDFPKSFRPLVQPIDTWFMNRRLGLIFEATVGKGKLLVCSADLKNNLDTRPAAKQLLYSLRRYMLSNDFDPKTTIGINTIQKLFNEHSRLVWDAFTKDSPDELKPVKGIQK